MNMFEPCRLWMPLAMSLMALAIGCQPAPSSTPAADYQTTAQDPHRDTESARRHNARGIELLRDGKLLRAEGEFKTALSADPFFGPAHNSLGIAYYCQKNFYLAATEFQLAAKIMARQAEPRSNLGLVFEAVGNLDEAARWGQEALDVEPGNVEATANLARVLVRLGRKDPRLPGLIRDILMKDTRPQWITWARLQLVTLPASESQPAEEDEPAARRPPAASQPASGPGNDMSPDIDQDDPEANWDE